MTGIEIWGMSLLTIVVIGWLCIGYKLVRW